MTCLQTLLGCASVHDHTSGLNFDMDCVSVHCATELAACLL